MNYIDYNFGVMDTLKKAGSRALKGWNDGEKTSYGKNIALRSGEGAVIGAGTGALAGNIAGRIKRSKAGQKAREEASRGVLNKVLNAINGDRLKNIEKEARKKVSLTKHTLAGMGIGAGTGAAVGASAGAIETHVKRNKARNKSRDERMSRLEEENKAERAAREKAEKDAERYKAQRGGVIPWAFRGVKKLAGKFMDWRAKKKKEWDDNHYTANDYWNDVGGGNPARFGMQHMSLRNYMTENGYYEFASKAERIANANNLAKDRTYNFGYVQGGASEEERRTRKVRS